MLLFAPETGGTGGGGPPAPPSGGPPPADPGGESPPEEISDEWKGWWAGQLNKETREKHKDGLLGLKGKQLGEVFDDFFSNRTKLENAVVFPGKDAKPEEIEAFLKRMDIPKAADEYGLDPKLIPSPDKDEVKAGAAKELADFFKSIGLTKNQANKMYERYTSIVKNATEAQAAHQKALVDTFEERLSKDITDEKARTETKEYFKRALIALGDKQLVQELNQSGLLYSTVFVRGIADIWKAGNQEPPIVQGTGNRNETVKDALPKGRQFEERYGNRRT
jgi:hypothetical protein